MSTAICHSCHCRWRPWVAAGPGVQQRHRGAEVLNAWHRCCLRGALREGFETAESTVRKMWKVSWYVAIGSVHVAKLIVTYIYIDISVQRFSSLFVPEIKEESPQYLIREHSPMMFDLSNQVGIMGWSQFAFDLYIWWKVLYNNWSCVHLGFDLI